MERQQAIGWQVKLFILAFALMAPILSIGQSKTGDPEMATLLYQNGKIYLVVFVLATIFAGIIFYLIRLEKKINKLEKNN